MYAAAEGDAHTVEDAMKSPVIVAYGKSGRSGHSPM